MKSALVFTTIYYNLDNPVYNATNWQTSIGGSIYQNSQGKTQTEGYWLQDAWDFTKDWNLTLGGRLENWHAFDGNNYDSTATGTKSINQAERNDLEFSPKAKLGWKPLDRVQTGLAIGQAYRFPTVTELFQTSTYHPGRDNEYRQWKSQPQTGRGAVLRAFRRVFPGSRQIAS